MIHTISQGMVKFFAVDGDNGYMLIDCGLKKSQQWLTKKLNKAEIDPGNIRLIVVTHAHPDHIGSLAVLKEMTGADVVAHSYAKEFIERGECSPAIPRTGKAKAMSKLSPDFPTTPVAVEHSFDDIFNLSSFGFSGKLVSTPGHTQGSLAVVMDNGDAVIADSLNGDGDKLDLHFFYEDRDQLIASMKMLAGYPMETIYMSHGGLVSGETFRSFTDALA